MRTIAIVNQKGGCGKTTTAINLAAIFARRGLRTLLVDMDSQSHCAVGLGVPEARIEYSLADALLAEPIERANLEALIWEVSRHLDLVPSTMRLAALEAAGGGLHELEDKDRRLAQLLARLEDRYDRCLIDCPPTIGLLTFNALRAAREAIIPVETGYFAMRGAEKQCLTIDRLIERLGRPITVHLLPTMFDPSSPVAREVLATLRRQFAGRLLPLVIHEHESLREAAGYGQPIIEYAPSSPAEQDFQSLADWLEEHPTRGAIEIEVLANRAPAAHPATDLGHGRRRPRSMGTPGAPAESAAEPQRGGRAAELAARVRELVHHDGAAPADSGVTEHGACSAPVNRVRSEPRARSLTDHAPSLCAALEFDVEIEPASCERLNHGDESPSQRLVHLFGARQTASGVLFVQPGEIGRRVCVAGDFNHWSAHAHPLRLNPRLGVHEALVAVPPGRHQYRLVVDGQWRADPFNEQQVINSYDERNSVLVVTESNDEESAVGVEAP